MDRTTMIEVFNRDNGAVVYSIPEMNGLTRIFQAGETKSVTFEELEKLSYIPGGMELLRQNLVITNKEAIKLLLGVVEQEYFYTEKDVINLMQKGSLDQFLDCLDFAPEGVIDLIKTLAVELPLNDVAKREAILKKTGFNVDNAIRIRQESTQPEKENTVPQRRVSKVEPAAAPTARRVIKKEA